ncbi:MAG: hypothetical protein ACK56F_26620, partial [bacterium]
SGQCVYCRKPGVRSRLVCERGYLPGKSLSEGNHTQQTRKTGLKAASTRLISSLFPRPPDPHLLVSFPVKIENDFFCLMSSLQIHRSSVMATTWHLLHSRYKSKVSHVSCSGDITRLPLV